jgi:hypothetical protein
MYSKDEIKELHLKFWQNFKIYCETQLLLNFQKKRWISVDSLKKEIIDIRRSIIDEAQFEHLCALLDDELGNNYGGSYGN